MKMKALDIVTLLKEKHYMSVCVEQCKVHVTWNTGSSSVSVPNSDWRAFALMKRNMFSKGTPERNFWFNCWKKSYKSESPLMDLWVLPRSWKHGYPICYEVKTSRADLFNDHKFPSYWDGCNYFYFAIPNGLLTKDEMNKFSSQVGFIEVIKSGKGLRIQKKPEFMSSEIDSTVYKYILFWRSKIVKSRFREFQLKKR